MDHPSIDDNDYGELMSFFVIDITLNDDYEGGTKEFRDPDPVKTETVTYTPTKGSIIMYEHGQRTRDLPVTRGTKYVLRTYMLYSSWAI